MLELFMQNTKKLINKIRQKIGIGSIVFDSNCGLSDTVFLASMGRSGSTLLTNVINYDNTHRILFEPFRYDVVSEAKDFIYPLYLRANNSDSRYLSSAQKIISGQVHSRWIDKENKVVFPKQRLIKDIRTNLFLKWIHNNFPEMKIILLLRHPCAVVASWLAADFGDGLKARDRLLADNSFINDMDDFILSEYLKAESGFESLIFFWCISYWIPFQQFNKDEIHLVFYENLFIDTSNELESLFTFLDRDYSKEEVLNALREPSSTTNKNKSFFRKGEVKINGWKNKFSSEQIDRAYEIMSLFGMETLYCPETSIPNRDTANQLFGSNQIVSH